jgi:hypothetical protein
VLQVPTFVRKRKTEYSQISDKNLEVSKTNSELVSQQGGMEVRRKLFSSSSSLQLKLRNMRENITSRGDVRQKKFKYHDIRK